MSKNRRLKKKMKNMMATVATLVLIAGVSVGITLALMATKTNEKQNTFTGSKGLDGGTFETLWDGSTAANPTSAPEANTGHYGCNDAKVYTPDMVINKNPAVSNKSSDQAVWVMMRVEYRIKGGTENAGSADTSVPVTYTEFKKLAKIYNGDHKAVEATNGETAGTVYPIDKAGVDSGINTTDWVAYTQGADTDTTGYLVDEADPTTGGKGTGAHVYYYYYYKTPLAKTAGVNPTVTNPLFTTVHINSANEITLTNVTSDSSPKTKYYKIEYPSTTNNTNFDGIKEYNTFSALPAFEINVQSAIVAKEATDPVDLNGTTGKEATILGNLFGTFQ